VTWLLVALGAAVGAPARYLVDRAVQARHESGRPWGTLAVNVAGSLVLGFVAGLGVRGGWSALVGTGFCGALTTWSTLGYETVRLVEEDDARGAWGNLTLSLAGGVAAAALGAAAATAWGQSTW
jgi:CrcB protein